MHELVENALRLETELAEAKNKICEALAPLHVGDYVLDYTAKITEVYIINLQTANPQFGYKARNVGKSGNLVGSNFSVYWNKERMCAELPERIPCGSKRMNIILNQLSKLADDASKENE